MWHRHRSRIGLCAVITFASPVACWSEARLPGDAIPLSDAYREPGGFLARCVAVDDPTPAPASDVQSFSQTFRVLDLVRGSTHGDSRAAITYTTGRDERPIRRGEIVYWFGTIAADDAWSVRKALPDTGDDLDDARRAADQSRYEHKPAGIAVSIDRVQSISALGEPLPVGLWVSRDDPDSILAWADFGAGHFDIVASDGEPVERSGPEPSIAARLEPFAAGTRRKVWREDLGPAYDWLAGRPMRSFTMVWRGTMRIGDRDATPVEVVSPPERFVIRDPRQLAWGTPGAGLACGLAAEHDSVMQGDRLQLQLGLRFDPDTAPPSLGMLNDYSREVGFTFTNKRTGESIARAPTVFVGIGLPMAGHNDFVPLHERPVIVRSIPVSLLTPEGEQLPEGTYSVVAWYQNEGTPQILEPDCWFPTEYKGPWTFWKGKLSSAPILMCVQRADSIVQNFRVNSGYVVQKSDGRTCWGLSPQNPLHVRVATRPGYYIGRKTTGSFAIGNEHRRPAGGQESSAVWEPGGGCMCRLTPEEEARLAAGERLTMHGESTIFETSNPPGHMWRPEAGDYRVLWRGSFDSGTPARH